jgi:hypothetical protein
VGWSGHKKSGIKRVKRATKARARKLEQSEEYKEITNILAGTLDMMTVEGVLGDQVCMRTRHLLGLRTGMGVSVRDMRRPEPFLTLGRILAWIRLLAFVRIDVIWKTPSIGWVRQSINIETHGVSSAGS